MFDHKDRGTLLLGRVAQCGNRRIDELAETWTRRRNKGLSGLFELRSCGVDLGHEQDRQRLIQHFG